MNLLLLAVFLLSNRENQDIVTFNYSGNDGCSFTVSVGQPTFRSYEDRWYPVIHGMGVAFDQDEYVLPSLICYIPIPPGCEPQISCITTGSQPAEQPGPLLVTPVMTGGGLDTEWKIPSIIPSVEPGGYAELRTFRILGTTVAAVTVNPFGGGNTGNIPLEISIRLTWPPAHGSREIDSPLLEAVSHPDLLFWPVLDRTDVTSPFWGRPWARMAVSSTGIYAVTGAELEQTGCGITGTPSRTLRVLSGPGTQYVLKDPTDEHQLSELAIEVCDGGDGVFDHSDTLIFFARGLERFDISSGVQRLSHRYATHNVYWLTWGGENGLRIDTVSAMPDASPEWGDNLLHRIWQEQEYMWVAGQEKRTGWVWTQLFENMPSYFYFSTLSMDGYGSLTLSIIPKSRNSGPHRIEIDLNGSVIEDTLWTGSREVILNISDLDFDPSMNLLKVTALEEPVAIYLNYFKVEYPRKLSYAANRMLRFPFVFSASYNFTFGGALGEFGLLDLTNPALPVRLEGHLSGADLGVALDLRHNSQFWLSAGASSYLSPDSITVSEPGRIIGLGIEGNVVIVVADQLMEAAEPLETMYAARGLSSVIVSAGEVYDEFGQGLRDPGAIRSFFRYTQDSWSEPPRSLLLVGDGSYDPLMHITAYPTLIPACIRLDTEDGTNYDDIFVIAHKDGQYPEVPISRIPASSEDELTSYLWKVMTYESQEGTGEWENRIVLVADDEWGKYSTQEYMHTASCELLADIILPASLNRIKFYMIEYPWPPGTVPSGDHPEKPDAREAFIQELSNGCANMIFFGHGSYGQLAHEKLLVSSDVQRIDNGTRQPVMIFASCDLGHFDMISANCLAEDFMLKPESGSIVSIGATRGTYSAPNDELFCSYYEELYGGGAPSIGEALWLAKLQTSSIGNSKFYVLFGDGGIHSVYPPVDGCSFEIPSDTLYRGRINTVTGSFRNSSVGFLNITESGSERVYSGIGSDSVAYLRYGSSIYQAFITGTDQGFSAAFFMPMQADTGSYSRGSAAGISLNGTEVAFDEWVASVDEGSHSADSLPPSIELWIDGYRGENVPCVSGDAMLRALLSDSSGICAIGGGAGRSILLSLDSRGFDISRYFTYRTDSYTCGEVEYSLPELVEGDHRIILVVWDGMGNTARDTLDFKVIMASEDLLSSVFVYPNPGEGQRCFNFETSSAGTAVITVYTVAGRTIWRKTATCNEGYNQVVWNGLDMDFDEPGSGAYIYRIDFSAVRGASSSVTDIMAIVRER
ncbi:MAG: T9SS type A sorting domain-containing protein [Candidatus Aegiribacteria sp.]|nr:T9SS type A sorting domain-containing protein [Candidatus Aegiribacteria sp.]